MAGVRRNCRMAEQWSRGRNVKNDTGGREVPVTDAAPCPLLVILLQELFPEVNRKLLEGPSPYLPLYPLLWLPCFPRRLFHLSEPHSASLDHNSPWSLSLHPHRPLPPAMAQLSLSPSCLYYLIKIFFHPQRNFPTALVTPLCHYLFTFVIY